MVTRASLHPQRSLFERFRPTPGGLGVPGIIPSLQAYGGLQAWAARTHRPSHTLGRVGSLEVRLAQTAAEVRQAQKLRYHVFYQEGAAILEQMLISLAIFRRYCLGKCSKSLDISANSDRSPVIGQIRCRSRRDRRSNALV